MEGINIKGAVVNGMKNLKKVLDIIKEDSSSFQFIEVMNCNGGCIAGGGQPKTTLLNMLKTKEARIGGLYSTDEKMVKRVSYKNPEIIKKMKNYTRKGKEIEMKKINQYNKLIEKTGNYWFSIDGENIEQQQTKVDSDFLFYEEGK